MTVNLSAKSVLQMLVDKAALCGNTVPFTPEIEMARAVLGRPTTSRTGAMVRYCGHDGMFPADVYEIGEAVVIHCPTPISPDMLLRPAIGRWWTHWVVDFPMAGFWRPQTGVLVVPSAQVRLRVGPCTCQSFGKSGVPWPSGKCMVCGEKVDPEGRISPSNTEATR